MTSSDLTACLSVLRYIHALLSDHLGTCVPSGMTPPFPTPAWVAGMALTSPHLRASYLRAELRENPDVRAVVEVD